MLDHVSIKFLFHVSCRVPECWVAHDSLILGNGVSGCGLFATYPNARMIVRTNAVSLWHDCALVWHVVEMRKFSTVVLCSAEKFGGVDEV